MEKESIKSHKGLEVYKMADKIRRSDAFNVANASLSRSVCANLAEAWIKRRYQTAFVAKLNDSDSVAAETQTWLKFAVKCDYLNFETSRELYALWNSQPSSRHSSNHNQKSISLPPAPCPLTPEITP
ncbi:four helix bundle protein [Nostoc sp. ChiSLP03a]|uniref:four helix bundle protein n=1 Tax=Nostoc sp. ChiSLP03a TaxID=3075380 RepID=UPI002AD4C147|nr:four helix bundle protein [Nostoc sp. ChiSLP03a]MDZ8213554.1 four helix bundle protein [Nostoc sp. ChiSLP03a]